MEELVVDNSSFKKRSDLHLARKVWHATGVLLIFLVYQLLNDKQTSLILLGLAWLIFVPFDILRQTRPRLNTVLLKIFKPIIRQSEVNKIAGTTYLLSGLLTIMALFPKVAVDLSMLFLALADPIASYVGIRFGKHKIFGHKSVQGFLAAFSVCFALSVTYFHYAMKVDSVIVLSLCAGLIGALSELVPVFKLDDNFTMPVLSATGVFSVLQLFGLI